MKGVEIGFDRVRLSLGATKFEFSANIGAGEIVSIMGPSGAGKSTLLNLLAGFEIPDDGKILIAGSDVADLPPGERPVTMVFQENNLFGHMDVLSNVGLGRSPKLKLSGKDRELVHEALRRTGLSGKEGRLPAQLSGGERRRVAIARALVRDRPVLLLDEPFASLGPALRREMLDLVIRLHTEKEMTILMVSHHPEDARALAGRILFLENGRAVANGHADEFFGANPPDGFVSYLGQSGAI